MTTEGQASAEEMGRLLKFVLKNYEYLEATYRSQGMGPLAGLVRAFREQLAAAHQRFSDQHDRFLDQGGFSTRGSAPPRLPPAGPSTANLPEEPATIVVEGQTYEIYDAYTTREWAEETARGLRTPLGGVFTPPTLTSAVVRGPFAGRLAWVVYVAPFRPPARPARNHEPFRGA